MRIDGNASIVYTLFLQVLNTVAPLANKPFGFRHWIVVVL